MIVTKGIWDIINCHLLITESNTIIIYPSTNNVGLTYRVTYPLPIKVLFSFNKQINRCNKITHNTIIHRKKTYISNCFCILYFIDF